MAKGQVTTDDLATGIKAFGGLSSLGGTPRAVRDNPFFVDLEVRRHCVLKAPTVATSSWLRAPSGAPAA